MLEFIWGISMLGCFIFIPLANVESNWGWFFAFICFGWLLAPIFLIALIMEHKERTEKQRKRLEKDISQMMEFLDPLRVDKNDKLKEASKENDY